MLEYREPLQGFYSEALFVLAYNYEVKCRYERISYRISKFIKRRSRQRPLSSFPSAKTPRVEIGFEKGDGC